MKTSLSTTRVSSDPKDFLGSKVGFIEMTVSTLSSV